MPKISESAYSERRARIMSAARKNFSRRGIHVSVDEICAAAGVSKGAFYGYFPSKDAIIQAMAHEHAADFAAIRAAPSLAALQSLLLARAWRGESEGSRLELEAWTYSLNNDALRRQIAANATDLRLSIEAALHSLHAAGAARLLIAADAAAAVIETFIIGAVTKAALRGDGEDHDIAARLRVLVSALVISGP